MCLPAVCRSLLLVLLASRFPWSSQHSTAIDQTAPEPSAGLQIVAPSLLNVSIQVKPAIGAVQGEKLQLSCGPLLRTLLRKTGNRRSANKTCLWTVVWLHNSTSLTSIDNGGLVKQRGRCGQFLRFMNVQPKHNGVYRCAVTAHGRSWSSKEYRLLLKGPKIAGLMLFFNKPHAVNVTWSFPPFLAGRNVRCVVKVFKTIKVPVYATQVCNTTRPWCQVNQLSRFGRSLVQVTPLHGMSVGEPVESDWFLPGWDTPLGVPSRVSAEPWTDCTLRVSWSLEEDYHSLILRGIIMVAIQYGRKSLDKMSNVSVRITDSSPYTYSYVLPGLACNTTYRLGVSVWTNVDNQQTSGIGQILEVRTASKAPPRVEVVTTSVSANNLSLQWHVPWPFSGNTNSSGFVICRTAQQAPLTHTCGKKASASNLRTTCTEIHGASHRSYTMKSLQSNTNYSIRVDAFNAFGRSSSTVVNTATPPSVPTWCPAGNVSSIAHCERVESFSLRLAWKTPSWNGQPVKIVAILQPIGSLRFTTYDIDTNRTSWTVTGLVQDQVYVVQLVAINTIGPSEWLPLPRCRETFAASQTSEISEETSSRGGSAPPPVDISTKPLVATDVMDNSAQGTAVATESRNTGEDISSTTLLLLGVSAAMLLLVVVFYVMVYLRQQRFSELHSVPELDKRCRQRKNIRDQFHSNDYGPLTADPSTAADSLQHISIVRWSSERSLDTVHSEATYLSNASESRQPVHPPTDGR